MKRFIVRVTMMASAIALVLGATPLTASAQVEFDEAAIFFEYNSTDQDLGIQIFFDATGWEEVEVEGPDGTIFSVANGGSLQDIGSTEVFTESAEPALCPEVDEEHCTPEEIDAAIAAFLARFPEGEYEFSGTTTDGEDLEGSAELSWDLPAPVEITRLFPTIGWEPGESNGDDDAEVVGFQVVAEMVVENDEEEEIVYVQATDVSADVTAVKISPEFTKMVKDAEADGSLVEVKIEIIAVGENGNKTITEEPVFELDEE